jgi:type II secretory pathway pseudopilin PulG
MLIKRVVRYLLIALAVLLCLISLIIPLGSMQVSKNSRELSDMKECVQAVEHFNRENGRLPTSKELEQLSAGLSSTHRTHQYEITTSSWDFSEISNTIWSSSGGWAIYYWRGEWYEYYTSWNNLYSLSKNASLWGFFGPTLFLPVIAVFLFYISRAQFSIRMDLKKFLLIAFSALLTTFLVFVAIYGWTESAATSPT